MPHLTKKLLMEMAPAEAPYKVSDEVVKGVGVVGLCVRVTPAGVKTFALQYRTRLGKKGWIKIGRFGDITLEQARNIARKHKGDLAHGVDPAQQLREAKEADKTISDLATRYLEEHVKVNNGAYQLRDATRILNAIILPALGKRQVREVGTSEVASLLGEVRKATPVQANRTRAVLSKMFAKAELWQMRDPGTNPCKGQDRAPEKKRDRRLVEREIRALGKVLRLVEAAKGTLQVGWEPGDIVSESPFALAGIRLLLLAGFRPGEVMGLEWAWVDLKAGIVTIPPEAHKTGKKSGKARVVYLGQAALAVLKALPRNDKAKAKHPNPYVLQGAVHGEHLVDIDAWERIRATVTELARRERKKARGKESPVSISDVTLHDLRRTFSSVGADMGFPELFMSALLGHAAGSVTQIYTRVGTNPLKDTAEAIGTQIAEWLG